MLAVIAGENWNCPYCHRPQVVTEPSAGKAWMRVGTSRSDLGDVGLYCYATACANTECRKLTLAVQLGDIHLDGVGNWRWRNSIIEEWDLLPSSSAKPQPDYVPPAITEDYYEACAILKLSPKASATLSRRCLQGMLRDFCKITIPGGRLINEIRELRRLVDAAQAPLSVTRESVEAIDAVREVGNIGAHMEADINVIIDVDEGEAELLVHLIETLIDDWYVARQVREERFAGVKAIRDEKKAQKAAAKGATGT